MFNIDFVPIRGANKKHYYFGDLNMKNILVLTGSPRKNGNSDMLADSFINGAAKSGHQAEIFSAGSRTINGCRACDTCFTKETACSFHDGFTDLEPFLERADAIVFVTPLYFYGMSAQIKAAIDKLYAYVSERCTRRLHITDCAFIICGGEDHLDTYAGAIETYKNIAKYMQWQDRGVLVAPGVFYKGDVKNTGSLAEAEKLGREF